MEELMKICIFEDLGIGKVEDFYPLTLTRPVFELKCGYTTLAERISRNFEGTEIYFSLRDYLVPTFKNRTGANVIDNIAQLDDFLFINGRWLMNKGELELNGPEEIGVCGEGCAYIRVKQSTIQSCIADTPGVLSLPDLAAKLPEPKEIKATLISYPWDLISNNPDAMRADFEFLGKKGVLGEFSELSTIYGGSKDDVYVAESAKVQPLVVLDVTHGPIFIDEEAVIFPHTRIEGPAYIGKDTRIVGGKIREGTSIGPVCRVGGEVEEAIIHGYSNKYHDGFLGHAYVGEWVNLGALTTNSDLKNDYTTVEVYVKGKLMDSGDTKVGCFIGDHTKTGLGSLFNTGTVVGVMSNVLPAGGLLPKLIPSFCIAHEGRFLRGRLRDLLATAKTAMGRRNVELTQEDVQLFEKLYELTKEERDEWIKKMRK
jgi:UDP-N-acetylglucosamine diphosphorylase/glucosamine-1-phosphate N-acetyltransferase